MYCSCGCHKTTWKNIIEIELINPKAQKLVKVKKKTVRFKLVLNHKFLLVKWIGTKIGKKGTSKDGPFSPKSNSIWCDLTWNGSSFELHDKSA